jgi:hypothetical protein
MLCRVQRVTPADICVPSNYYARKPKHIKTYLSDTQQTTPLTHPSGISHLPLVQSVFRLWALVISMIYQEPRGDIRSGGTSRGAIEEI